MPDAPDRITDVRAKLDPIVLIILDGWGMSAGVSGNAIRQANPTNFVQLWHEHPHGILRTVSAVDEAAGMTGNSDTGHASIGTGRLIHSDSSDISLALASGAFFRSPGFGQLMADVQATHGPLHMVGLLSRHSAHGRFEHLLGCLELAKRQGLRDVVVHAILDDQAPNHARQLLAALQQALTDGQLGRIGSVCGRSYALDRSGDWQRTRQLHRALIGRGAARHTVNELMAGLNDPEIEPADVVPTTILLDDGTPAGLLRAGETVLLTNTRPDRITQLARALADHSALAWLGLIRQEPFLGLHVWTLTDYHLGLADVRPIFQTAEIPDSLGRIVADHGLAQARIATLDRLSHVTYYLNGGRSNPFDHEERFTAYTRGTGVDPRSEPAGGVTELVDLTLEVIARQNARLIVVNLDAVDRAAHTGDIETTMHAVSAVDAALAQISQATLAAGGALIVTADHGNAESLLPSRGAHHHTSAGVPWIVATTANRKPTRVAPGRLAFPAGIPDHRHSLADIAPTILGLLGIAKPSTMTGRNLLE